MLFSSSVFLFRFLPILFVIYFLIPAGNLYMKNLVLLIASLIFYSWGEPVYVFLMVYSAVFNFFMARLIQKRKKNRRKQVWDLVFTLVVNLFILCFFKYFGFMMDTIGAITGHTLPYVALPLPIGISFYTFQALSYVIDVYREKVKAQNDLLTLALYLAFFPQLIAGPIVKYRDIETQLTERPVTMDDFGEGVSRFITGLAKKVLLANNLGLLHQTVLSLPDDKSAVATCWIGMIAYTLQIYFDFSGYSDMAIGLGRMFGFRFMENFNYPYISRSVTEFWRRWHISLSTWFREYLYFPLGGNRVRPARHILNLLIVWFLTGLWHGASWNFVVWGLYYCLFLILEKYVLKERIERLPVWGRHIYTMLAVSVGWVLFFSDDLPSALGYLRMAVFAGGAVPFNMTTAYLLRTNALLLAVSVFTALPFLAGWYKKLRESFPALAGAVLLILFIVSTAFLVYGSYNPFLYFRF